MTPAQARSVAALLQENALAHRRLAPASADAMAAVAAKLLELSRPRRTRAVWPDQQKAVGARAEEWMKAHKATLPHDAPAPSERAVIRAAKGSGIQKRALMAARKNEWPHQ